MYTIHAYKYVFSRVHANNGQVHHVKRLLSIPIECHNVNESKLIDMLKSPWVVEKVPNMMRT